MITLRHYQSACVDAVYHALKQGERRILAQMDTGSGKSPTIVALIQRTLMVDPDARIVVLVDRKELVEQLAGTWEAMAGSKANVYAASLDRRENGQVLFCQIQSVYNKPNHIGKRKLAIVDEAHAIPDDGEGMYRSLLRDLELLNSGLRVVGFTATPYRLGYGKVYGQGRIFDKLVYNTDMKQLIREGYLSPLISKNGAPAATFNIKANAGGDYVQAEAEALMCDARIVEQATEEILKYSCSRKHVLVFACGIRHADLVKTALCSVGIRSEVVTGEDDQAARDAAIARFKRGETRCLINIQVLTTGFDFKAIDMLVLLRPTLSPGLYSQMVGRGLRIAEGKTDCLVLDMGGNIERHGPVDEITIRERRPSAGEGRSMGRTCPSCFTVVHLSVAICPSCGHKWPRFLSKHSTEADDRDVLSIGAVVKRVDKVFWTLKNHRTPDTHPPIYIANVYIEGSISPVWFYPDKHRLMHGWGIPEDVDFSNGPAVCAAANKTTPPTRALVKPKAGGGWSVIRAFKE